MTPIEIEKLAQVMGSLGIRKVRITGGEPLTRPDLEEIISRVARVRGITEIGMTTNGMGLAKRVTQLKAAGLKRINISMDSMDPENYAAITRGGDLEKVMEGLAAALAAELLSVRINIVVMQGINDHEIDDFMALAREYPVDVRFIELMPIGGLQEQHEDKLRPNIKILEAHPELRPDTDGEGSQPAVYYTIPGYRGRIGLISPISHKFCAACNRIRVTWDGKIKPCLGDNTEVDFISVLRDNPERLEGFLRGIVLRKPTGHHFDNGFNSNRNMAAIGG